MGISYWAVNNLLRRHNWVGDHFTFRILELINLPSMLLYIKANIILGKQISPKHLSRTFQLPDNNINIKIHLQFPVLFSKQRKCIKTPQSQWKHNFPLSG